jgi:hypothetical protein
MPEVEEDWDCSKSTKISPATPSRIGDIGCRRRISPDLAHFHLPQVWGPLQRSIGEILSAGAEDGARRSGQPSSLSADVSEERIVEWRWGSHFSIVNPRSADGEYP